jgi:hypothetical protein
MPFLRYLALALVAGALSSGALRSDQRAQPLPDLLIGYTEFRSDLTATSPITSFQGA